MALCSLLQVVYDRQQIRGRVTSEEKILNASFENHALIKHNNFNLYAD